MIVPARGAKLFFRVQNAPPIDTDGDGLTDYEEFVLGSDPTKTDTDGDGLTDFEEFKLKYYYGVNVDPTKAFTVPGIKDGSTDSDGDGVSDIDELRAGTNPLDPTSYPANHPNLDTDGNGLPDAWQMQYFGHLGNDPDADPDGDGLTNRQEYLLHTNPLIAMTDGVHIDGQADSDGDGVLDIWELQDGTDPFNAASVDLATNYIVLSGTMLHKSQWGPVTDIVQFNGTILRATAVGFETAQQAFPTNKAFGIVNEVANFGQSGADYVAQKYVRFRKGVNYNVQLVTSSNNLPFVSGKFAWTTVGNSDDPANKFFEYDVTNRQLYVANGNGTAVPAMTITPNPDAFDTHFTLVSPSQGGPDVTTYSSGLLNLSGIAVLDLRNAGDVDDVTVNTFKLNAPAVGTGAQVVLTKNRYWKAVGTVFAYIVPHRNDGTSAADDPRMPQLKVRFVTLGMPYQVKWKFSCSYVRGNGFRPSYSQPSDTIMIPATGTRDLPGDSPWLIYQEVGWPADSDPNFFGGDCTITYQVFDTAGMAVTPQLSQNLVIGGFNPDSTKARAFIDVQVATISPTLYYAYAISKEESGPYSGDANRKYNQFFTDFLPNDRLQPASDWRGWRSGLPTFNDDPGGPGGYGMFQNTRSSIPRQEIWNWQQNSIGGITEINGKIGEAQSYLNDLDRTYPGAEPRPTVSATFGTVTRTVSALDATVMTAYNGFDKKTMPKILVTKANGKQIERATCWTYDPTKLAGQRWTFQRNQNDYVRKVLQEIE